MTSFIEGTCTPGRRTQLVTQLSEVVVDRPRFSLRRNGVDIKPNRAKGAIATYNMMRTGAGDHILALNTLDSSQIQMGGAAGFASRVSPVDSTAVGNLTERGLARTRTDLVDSEPNATLDPDDFKVMQLQREAGSSWRNFLDGDVLAYPYPNDAPATGFAYPIDRLLVSNNSDAPCQPYAILLVLPKSFEVEDVLARFYFGGYAEVTPHKAHGGGFCLTLRGDGVAELREFSNFAESDPWVHRYTWPWLSSRSVNTALFYVIPYGRNAIDFWSVGIGTDTQHGAFSFMWTLGGALVSLRQTGANDRRPHFTYVEQPQFVGHEHVQYATGPGPVRFDVRRINRAAFGIYRLTHPETGVLADNAFRFRGQLPVATPFQVTPDIYLPPGTAIHVDVRVARTHALVPIDGQGNFLSVFGETDYYPVFTFTGNGPLTPVLKGYDVTCPGTLKVIEGARVVFDTSKTFIVGPDLDPSHEYAVTLLEDPYNEASPVLRLHDRLRSAIEIVDASSELTISRIFEGELSQPDARLRGDTFSTVPPPNWTEYGGLRLNGVHARINEQVTLTLHDFARDPKAPVDPDTGERKKIPWRIVDIIREGLLNCGFGPDEVDIPNIPTRLWPTGENENSDWKMMPGASWGLFLTRLSLMYLGFPLVRDPNAGPRGMWRIIPYPRTSGTGLNVLWRFWLDPPPGALSHSTPVNVLHPALYGAAPAPGIYTVVGTFVQAGTWKTRVKAPEINYLSVSTVGEAFPGDTPGHSGYSQWAYNPTSFSWPGGPITENVNHPDWLGRMVPGFISDPTLGTQAAVDYYTKRGIDFAGHAEKWAFFVAPLVLNWDTLDAHQFYLRPPRINDLAYVRQGGVDVLATVRSCNPDYQHDWAQWASYELRFVNPVSGL